MAAHFIMTIKEYLQQNDISQWMNGEQGRIDLKILPYLQDIENGFFVEAGALDGLFMSNTKILEDCAWKGLLIEPSLKAYKKCCENRPKSIVGQCALVSKDYTDPRAYGDFWFDGEDGIGAWSGINKNPYGVKAVASVPARTLDSIFKEFNITKVDFFSLDVEGYELEALKGIDFSTVDITYFLVEVNLKDYSLEDMNSYLGQFGYTKVVNLSNFQAGQKGWDGSHQDFLYSK